MKEDFKTDGKHEINRNLLMFFRSLWGDQTRNLTYGWASEKYYQDDFVYLLKTMKKSILQSDVQTDNLHFKELMQVVDKGIFSLPIQKSMNDIYSTMIISLSELVFTLLGGYPESNYYEPKDLRGDWGLNNYRQISYTQNNIQREHLMAKLVRYLKLEEFNKPSELRKAFWDEHLKGEKMDEWFMRTRPVDYLRIFGRVN